MFLAFFAGLFFGYIHFHAGPCCRPQKYRLVVDVISCTSFFKGVVGTRFGFLELKIGSLESEKIINGNMWMDTAISITSKYMKFSRKLFGSLQIHTRYLMFSLQKTLAVRKLFFLK